VTQVPRKVVSIETGSILKPLPPGWFVDYREVEAVTTEENDLALNAETRWEMIADAGYLTPNELFFVRSHAPTPRIDASSWRLLIDGPGVRRSLELSYDDLLRMENVSVVRALECAGNGRVFFDEQQGQETPGTQWRLGAIGVAEWDGISLGAILERAGLKGTARDVMLESLDAVRMRRPLPVEKALEEDTLLALGMNGEPLPPDHGFPARVVVPRWAAVASVKWVGRIHVSEGSLFSPWNTEKYVLTGGAFGEKREPVTAQVVKSALELAWPARLPRGRYEIQGRSWSPHDAISRVEYSVDGRPWRHARLVEPNIPGAWVRWSFAWNARPGDHEVQVKATDKQGNSQPETVSHNELGYLYGGVVGHPISVY
jgi:DMSO/TMAO reductase YedYZ molybdopterin-dependent catalytic subunit